MSLWKESEKSPASSLPDSPPATDLGTRDVTPSPVGALPSATGNETRPPRAKAGSESHIAPDLVIEGKIEGAGHVLIAGRFKGDIDVRGDVTIEAGAKVEGGVRAERVTVAGELTGNIETATSVELTETGALTGDVKSKTFTVAKGSKMRGQVEFGWEDSDTRGTAKPKAKSGTGGLSATGSGVLGMGLDQ